MSLVVDGYRTSDWTGPLHQKQYGHTGSTAAAEHLATLSLRGLPGRSLVAAQVVDVDRVELPGKCLPEAVRSSCPRGSRYW